MRWAGGRQRRYRQGDEASGRHAGRVRRLTRRKLDRRSFRRRRSARRRSLLLGGASDAHHLRRRLFPSHQAGAPDSPESGFLSTPLADARDSCQRLQASAATRIQISFSYSDGFGREIQKKIQAEPGPTLRRRADVSPRWAGSGWTIFNNKGKPVRQYEPFFSSCRHGISSSSGIQVGISPILFYDPVERVVATLHPNHT